MQALTAILFFCFTDMIQVKEIQSSKVFHIIKCRTEIKGWVKDVSLKELATNFTILKFSPHNNGCTSYTSNAACFVEREGNRKFSILQFYTDNIGGNISYVCVKRMDDQNGMDILTTFTATSTVDDPIEISDYNTQWSTTRITTDPIQISDYNKHGSTTRITKDPIEISEYNKHGSTTRITKEISDKNSRGLTTRITTDSIEISNYNTHGSTTRITTDPIEISDYNTHGSTTRITTDLIEISNKNTYGSTTRISTDPIQISDYNKHVSTTRITKDPIEISDYNTHVSTTRITTDYTQIIDKNTHGSTTRIWTACLPIQVPITGIQTLEDEKTFFSVLVITMVIISGLVVILIVVVCVVFRRKLKRQGAMNTNTSAIGGVQSDSEVISSGHFAQTIIGTNSGTDFAFNMELLQINHDGEPFPCHGEVSFHPTAVGDFGSSGTAMVIHPDPHVPECQNPSPSQGSYVGRSLDSVDEIKF